MFCFSSVFHFLPSHSISKHILFAFRPSLESAVINYLFCLTNLSILKCDIVIAIAVVVVVVVRKKSFATFSQKTLIILISNFDQSLPLPIRHLS